MFNRTRFVAVILLLSGFGLGEVARAEIFRWVDQQGKNHFAQDLQSVPRAYRKQAKAGAAHGSTKGNDFQTYQAPVVEPHQWEPIETPTYRKGVREIKLRHSPSGMGFVVDVRLNDRLTVPFVLDTGATHVVITQAVAEQLGIGADANTRWLRFQTANGIVKQALVVLDSVAVEGASVADVEGSISPSMPMGLLGTAFLNNFEYSIDPVASVLKLRERNRE